MNYTDFLKILYTGLRACFILVALIVPVPGQTMSNLSMHQAQSDTPIVRWLRISGNRAFSSGELKASMMTRASPWYDFRPWVKPRRYDATTFGADLERLRKHYRDRGYLEAEVDSTTIDISPDEIGLKIHIKERDPTRISRVWVMGLGSEHYIHIADALDVLVDTLFSRDIINRGVSQVVSELRNKGYAFARRELDKTSREQLAELVLKLTPGPVCSVRAVHISGDTSVAQDVIKRGLTFQVGDQFSEKALQNSQYQLYRARVFQSVSVTDSMVSKNQVDVNVRVSERPFRVLRLDAGYDTDEGMWTSGAWTHRNIDGGARQLKLSGRISQKNRETELGLRQPYFLGSRNWLNINGFLQRTRQAAFQQDEVGGELSLERNFTTDSDLVIQFSSGMVDFSADSAFAEAKVGLLVDTRDNIFDPQSGMLTQFTARERGWFFQADNEFLQTTTEVRWFRRLPLRNVLALRVRGRLDF